MKLVSIKAHGFKSFADKIEITINDGITGIVGPNGSGKSNVVDAVKWVLGENSLKELRGGENQADIIFNGSNTRKEATRAWVSLTFDNSDHYLASDFQELEIKREVFKSGESEYYINNSKVRKKDITDLFLDSGTSSSSFSIISQGKVLEVLKGKPLDRRVILEEAAGVLKYKKRKEETNKKLKNTYDNLEKVSLVIDELSLSLEPLRLQKETATKYLEYKKDLESIEVALITNDIKEINDKYTNNKELLSSLNEELLSMDNTTTKDTSKIETLKAKNIKLDEEISSLSSTIMDLTGTISSLETKKQVISERKKYEVEDQKLENNILSLKENNVALKKELSLLETEVKSLKTKESTLSKEKEEKEEELRVTNMRKETLRGELNKHVHEDVVIKNKIESLKEILETDAKLPFAVKSVLNNPRLIGIENVLSKMIKTEEKYGKVLEVSLGANQNVIVTKDEESAKKAIEYLKDNKLGRVTFFPISVIKERCVDEETLSIAKSTAGFIDIASSLVEAPELINNIVLNQLGNILVVKDINTLNMLGKKINYRYRIVTLDGEILHTGGAITGGVKANSNGIINTNFELNKYINDANKCENDIKLLENHLNELERDIKILEEKLYEDNSELSKLTTAIDVKNEEIKKLNTLIDNNETELKGTENVLNKEVDKEYDEVLKEYLSVLQDKDKKNIKLEELKASKNDLVNEINELELLNRQANSDYNKKLNQIKDLEVEIGKMNIKLDNLLNRLSEEYTLTYERASAEYVLDIDIEVARSKVNHLRRSIKDLGEVNVGSIAEFDRINERYEFLTSQKSDLENAINNLLEVINDLDETMKEKLESTYVKVNEEFTKVFTKLFKGGRANLVLTEPNDILNTGIEIEALPPGKSLKSINALSGGEMTLTAIALLFSILNIRVVPFCILDEVEAALDENNVDTFGTYLENYENNTQFIVITHKKKTMEYAKTLYGITMQESGVSKLVSVKLENI